MIVSLYTSSYRSPFWLKLLPIKIQVMSHRRVKFPSAAVYTYLSSGTSCDHSKRILSALIRFLCCHVFFVCDESEFLNMVPVCLQHFSFKNATKNRLFTTIRFDTFSFVCLIVTLSELGGWKTFARRLQKTAWCREPFVFLGVGYSLYVDSKEGRANHTPKHTSQWTQMSRSCLLQE